MNSCQEKRRKNKQCIDCGKQDNNTLNGKCRCEDCAKKQRENNKKNKQKYSELKKQNREYLKSRNKCTVCGKQDAYTMNGHTRCAQCTQKHTECNKTYYEKHKQEELAKKQIAFQENKKIREKYNMCTVCGKKLEQGYKYKTCEICRYKSRKRQEKKRINNGIYPGERGKNGVCYICNKEKATHGRLCDKCFEKANNSLECARKVIELKKEQGIFESSFYDSVYNGFKNKKK